MSMPRPQVLESAEIYFQELEMYMIAYYARAWLGQIQSLGPYSDPFIHKWGQAAFSPQLSIRINKLECSLLV
jgi:hypothetical protein